MMTLEGETPMVAAHEVTKQAVLRRINQKVKVDAAISMLADSEERERLGSLFALYVEYDMDCHRALDVSRHEVLLERQELIARAQRDLFDDAAALDEATA